MTSIHSQQLLESMRALQQQAQGSLEINSVNSQPGGGDFSKLLTEAIDHVNTLQKTSGDIKTDYVKGSPEVDLVDVVIAGQKSRLAFQAMLQVRNKLVEAYKDVMSMNV